jgi:hypothetical protein
MDINGLKKHCDHIKQYGHIKGHSEKIYNIWVNSTINH